MSLATCMGVVGTIMADYAQEFFTRHPRRNGENNDVYVSSIYMQSSLELNEALKNASPNVKPLLNSIDDDAILESILKEDVTDKIIDRLSDNEKNELETLKEIHQFFQKYAQAMKSMPPDVENRKFLNL